MNVSKGYKAKNDFIFSYAEHSIIIFSLVVFILVLIFNKFEDFKYFLTLAKQLRKVKSAEKFHSHKLL